MICTEKVFVDDVGDGYSGNMECRSEMKEIGSIGKHTEESIFNDIYTTGIRETILYQCPSCKTIKLY